MQTIGKCEAYDSWSLMHRYFKIKDLLRDVQREADADYLVVWLRYSTLRQLTWQRRFNTKPKELQHAQVSLIDQILARLD